MEHKNAALPNTVTTGTYFSYSIPGLDITPGPFIYTLVSQFLSMITPTELPFGQIRQLLHTNLTIIEFATNAIKIESGFIVLMSIFTILALVPFIATCAWCCSRRTPDDDFEFNRHMPIIIDNSLETSLQCRRKASIITLWICFLLLAVCDLSIFYANSRLATTIEMTPEMVKSTIHDVEVFLKDTHLQIKHKLDNGFHVSIEKVVKDLEDVDVLLGEPIQAEISAHTGIELAYDSLATITLANAELIYRVLMLQETVGRALKLSQEAAVRMEELQIQLSVLQRQCTYRDRPLCDTLRIRSFEENGLIDALKTLQEDQTIFRMRYLGEIEFGSTIRNLSSEVGMSHTLEQLESIRFRTTANAQMLTATINALLERLQGIWERLFPSYLRLQEWSNIYWTIGWVTALVIIWIVLFMLMSYCCFLCDANVKAGIVLFIAVIIVCISSICITLYGVVSLAIGGNAEVFLCRPLYDDNNDINKMVMSALPDNDNHKAYDMLSKLFDKPGYVYADEPQTSIIGELLRPAGVNHSVVNVSLATTLRGCEKNEPSYNVFQLDAFVNTTAISNLKQFPKVTKAIDSIEVSERTLLSLTQTIQNILESMLQISSFNLTAYRATIGSPTPEKDLATFIEQMQRVALQIQDVATSSRMTTLGSRSKRLQASILQPLEQQQNEILYHLTALELQRDPWAKQVNQTMNHLRNVQEYLEKTVGEICHNQTRIYTERLKTYLTNSKATMSSQLGDTTAKCRPFFDIFDANRIFICRNAVDFINALWFCTFLALLLWSIGTPVGLNMITLQRKMNSLKKAKMCAVQRAAERRDSPRDTGRGRRKERDSSSSRDRSTSSAGRQRPQLRRSATEETLDIAEEPSSSRGQPERHQREREKSRERDRDREISRERDREGDRQGRSREAYRRNLAYQGARPEDRWGSSGPRRGTSHEPESSQSKVVIRSNSMQQQQQQRQPNLKTKPPLRKQGTEESELEQEQDWQSSPSQTNRFRRKERQPTTSETPSPTTPIKIRRSMTPVLHTRPDAQPAQPLPRTPTRLKNRVSLTTRAVAQITKVKHTRTKGLQRTGTEEYDLNESESYGTSRSKTAALETARKTPPRSAPPPPPLPTSRFPASQRTVRWNTDDDEEDLVFEACN
uniref:Prominin n=1 Tax=Glossina palpalis gambiensis TaxID=67801 RepID=A0A1B0AP20_9MUSC